MQLYVGQSFLKGDFARYIKRFNFLELLAEPHRLPKVTKLASHAQRAPSDFAFSVVLSPRLFGSDAAVAQQALQYGLSVQRSTGARWLVLRTPPGLRPGANTEQQLAARLAELRECGARLAWEPRGLWQPHQAAELAQRLGVQLVLDAAAALEPGARWGQCAYVRVLGVGTAARINDVQLERLVERWTGAGEAYVAVDAPVAQRIRATLFELLEYADDAAFGEDEGAWDSEGEDLAVAEDEARLEADEQPEASPSATPTGEEQQ